MSATGFSPFKRDRNNEKLFSWLKPCFAQIRPSFACTYLALVFSVNKWKSILVKKLAASKKKSGYWLHTMHFSNIPVFVASTKEKIYQLSASDWFQLSNYITIISKKFDQVTELMTDFLCKIRNLHPDSYSPEQFFIFFGFNIVCQLLACDLSKEIEKMKN